MFLKKICAGAGFPAPCAKPLSGRPVPAHRSGALSSGFTLVEILVALALMMTLAVFMAPSLRTVWHRAKTMGCAQQISVALQQARFEAIKKGTPVTVGLAGTALTSTSGGNTLARVTLPSHVSFEATDGFGGTDLVSFQTDGSVDNLGAFRIVDAWGNHLEIRVEPKATARIEIRKKNAANVYVTEGTGGAAWTFQ